jgi:hypothetical protein
VNPPFLTALQQSRHVLFAGAGGGFDVFAALPLYHSLKSLGITVSLANLSYSELLPIAGENITPDCIRVTAHSEGPHGFFPEKHLAAFLARFDEPTPIYCIRRTGCRPVIDAYQALFERLQFDALVLVDGGTDSLMRGDEQGLGTPEEDAASLTAAGMLPLDRKFLAVIGFGVDHAHGVCDAHAFQAIAQLTAAGAYQGTIGLAPDMPEVRFYRDAILFANHHMHRHESLVDNSILSSLDGYFGDHHATDRTRGSTLHITPLMSLYFTFLLDPVSDRLLYRDAIRTTESYDELSLAIEYFRSQLPKLRPYTPALPTDPSPLRPSIP